MQTKSEILDSAGNIQRRVDYYIKDLELYNNKYKSQLLQKILTQLRNSLHLLQRSLVQRNLLA